MINSVFGCLTLILGFFIFLFLLKFWIIAFLFLLVVWILAKNLKIISNISLFKRNKEFTNKPGEVYKECSFCNKKAERTAVFCNNCGRQL